WLLTAHERLSGWPLAPAAGAVTVLTTRSAQGVGVTSNRLPASAALFDSEAFSKTTFVMSDRTNRWNRPWKAGGSRNDSLRVYPAATARAPVWSNRARTMSSRLPATASGEATTASVQAETEVGPVPL